MAAPSNDSKSVERLSRGLHRTIAFAANHFSNLLLCTATGPNAFLVGAFCLGVQIHAPINCACVRRGACRLLQFGSNNSTGACCKHGARCKHGDCCKLDASTTAVTAQFQCGRAPQLTWEFTFVTFRQRS
jgi:hypothetical protein